MAGLNFNPLGTRSPAPYVAQGSNRLNLSAKILPTPEARSSQLFTNLIAAGGNEVIVIPGNSFYFPYLSASLNARPNKGIFNTYAQGTGLRTEQPFVNVELQNPTSLPILYAIFIGFDTFIDKRLIIDVTTQPLVAIPVCSVASSVAAINIPDLSRQAVTDINGGTWWAIAREAIYVFNPDTGVTLLLQKAGSQVSNGPAVAVIYPQTTLRFPSSGNFCLNLGGALINAIVSDMYSCLTRTP